MTEFDTYTGRYTNCIDKNGIFLAEGLLIYYHAFTKE